MNIQETKGETTYTLTLTTKQLRMLQYFAASTCDRGALDASAVDFLKATENTEAANLPVDFNTRFTK